MRTVIIGGAVEASALARKIVAASTSSEIVLLTPGYDVPVSDKKGSSGVSPELFFERYGVKVITGVTPLRLDRPHKRIIVRNDSGVIGSEFYDEVLIMSPVPDGFDDAKGCETNIIQSLEPPGRFPIEKRIRLMLARRAAGAPPALRRSSSIVLYSDALDRTVAAFAVACLWYAGGPGNY